MVAVSTAVEAIGPSFFYPDMPLEQLRPSPMNPRKHFSEASLEELANNIREVGLLQPIVARLHGDHYEIVAGERRYRASRIAGLTNVPVSVKTLSDTQALEVMVIENNQREDITALEEADGFKQLLATGYDVDRLAERIGRSKKYVYDRIKLLQLEADVQKLLDDGRISAGHAILLARLSAQDQRRAIEPDNGGAFESDQSMSFAERREERAHDPYFGMSAVSVRALEAWIDQNVRLDLASRVEPSIFPDVAHAQETAARVVSITFDHYLNPNIAKGKAAGDRILVANDWKRADGAKVPEFGTGQLTPSKTCDRSLLGVVVIGRGRGRTFQVCVDKGCDVHWKKERQEREPSRAAAPHGSKPSAAEAAKQKAAREKWEAERQQQIVDGKLWDKLRPLVFAAAVDQVKNATALTKAQADVIGVVDCYDPGPRLEKLLGKSWFKSPVAAWLTLAIVASESDVATYSQFITAVAKPLGLDPKPFDAIRLKHVPVQTSAQKPKAKANTKAQKKR